MCIRDRTTGKTVDPGELKGYIYTISVDPGMYEFSMYDTDGTTFLGSLDLTVEDKEKQSFRLYQGTFLVKNTNDGGSIWTEGEDYTLSVNPVSYTHLMLPVVTEFVRKYKLDNFIVVADSGLMNNDNIADLEANGYKYIIGARIKNESRIIKDWILGQPKSDCQMVEYDKGNGQRLLVGYTEKRARKDSYNREKGIRRLEKAYNRGTLTKDLSLIHIYISSTG